MAGIRSPTKRTASMPIGRNYRNDPEYLKRDPEYLGLGEYQPLPIWLWLLIVLGGIATIIALIYGIALLLNAIANAI